ncbi:MAG: response regulator [Candidatus Thiodiazotropha sp. (ex Epidulcina cf. delphinae)]|nr:response regulator [Candidatus Thiodiazotropha sp. (ex Epidulcina cf. delphinae)]
MKLRTQILILLFLFGFAPLTAMVVSNLPFVLERLEFFYHKAYLQNLRADFRDLDEHLASRHEMLRLLAKLPEPGLVLGQREAEEGRDQIDQARVRYTEWINRILRDHLDIFQILFLDLQGNPRFWLELNARTHQWEPTIKKPDMPSRDFFQHSVHQEFGRVAVSKISLNPSIAHLDPRRFMTLRMISPIIGPDSKERVAPLGAVVINIDVGGMARAYRNTLWVTSDGAYLDERLSGSDKARAFEDFTGLQGLFEAGSLALWEGRGRQVIWVPLFTTEGSGPLWVGRPVDPSPLDTFRNVLISRVMTIVLVALVILLMVARWIALRTEQFGEKLRGGVERVLREDAPVRFDWHGSSEIKQLGRQLTELAETHAQQAEAQRQHARQLEESNRYKSEFLTNVSHELRTPLNSILLLSKMLTETRQQFTPEQKRQLQVIHEAGCDLRALIDNILDLSRIEAGKASISLQQIPLRPLVSDLIDLVKPQFDAKGLALALELEQPLAERFLSDQEKVRQILKNFLSNALKFTRQGGATLRVYNNTQNGARPVCFAVQDTGIGIPRDKHELVFEAFKQADGSTSRRFGGTGLGLSISRELAHLLGGEITLQSDEGKGAVFTLCLPLEFDQRDLSPQQLELQETAEPELLRERRPPQATQPAGMPPSAPFAGLRVLVVDDDLQSLLALTPQLEAWGFEVAAAGDGREAIDTLNEDQAFDLVLMDIMMPEVDGYDTIRHIRKAMRLKAPKIIVLSARNTPQDHERSLAEGADDFLLKPIDSDKLKTAISRHLG